MNKEFRISTSDPDIPQVGLGEFVDGFDRQDSPIPLKLLIWMSVFAVIFLIPSIIMRLIPLIYLASRLLVVCAVFYFVRWFSKKRTRVFVYQNGFVWETVGRNGKKRNQEIIDFCKVNAIEIPTVRHFNFNNKYTKTSYTFIVKLDNNETLVRRGTYINEFEEEGKGGLEYGVIKAIMDLWTHFGTNQIMEITIEHLTDAIRNHRTGKSIDPQLVELGVTDSWIDSLISAYYHVEESGMGGSSDWDGGGNPHRMMEEMERNRASSRFDDVCEELNLNPGDCRAALYNAGVR